MATVQLREADGRLTITLSGVLDIYAAREACAALAPALSSGARAVALEVAGLEELDLAGVQVLEWTRATAAARGVELELAPPGEVVLRAMRSLHLPGWERP